MKRKARGNRRRGDTTAPDALLWTVDDVARAMKVSVRTVWRLASDPRSDFPKHVLVRGCARWRREDVLAYIGALAAA